MNTGTLPRNALTRSGARDDAGVTGDGQHKTWWTWAKRVLTVLFFAAVIALLARYGRNIDWDDVWSSIVETPMPALVVAGLLAATSHLLYSCFDLIGKRYTGHKLPTPTVMAVW